MAAPMIALVIRLSAGSGSLSSSTNASSISISSPPQFGLCALCGSIRILLRRFLRLIFQALQKRDHVHEFFRLPGGLEVFGHQGELACFSVRDVVFFDNDFLAGAIDEGDFGLGL